MSTWLGFLVAGWSLTWVTSLVFGGVHLLFQFGETSPAVRRSTSAWALLAPPLVATAVVLALLLVSVRALAMGQDHCNDHGHHLHLCLQHGWGWAKLSRTWLASAWATALIAGLIVQVWRHLAARRALVRLRDHAELQDDVVFVAHDRPFCFVAGLAAPRVYVSTAAWQALDETQRKAVLAHERGHARRRDPAWQALLAIARWTALPRLGERLLRDWQLATEQACDEEAVRAIGDPVPVAEALLVLSRLQPAVETGLSAAQPSMVPARVRWLLGDRRDPRGWLGLPVTLWAAVVLGLAVLLLRVEFLHHLLESWLG